MNVRPAPIAIAIAMLGCRGERRAPEQTPVHPVQSATAPVQTPVVPAASSPPTPTADATLHAVPPEIAAKVGLAEVAHGFARPVQLVVAPGDTRRMFVVEQRGAIRVLEDGAVAKQPFFTIKDLSDGDEQGLLGLAFHPRFADNHRLYINYTARDGATHIVEYKAEADHVDPATRRELVRIAQPYSNHNGGNLVFGPDGKLYTGMGDGGAANDPHRNGQNDKVLLAKLLRFDVDATQPAPEIVHRGLRNPWRFSFDAKTGDLYIGDVGQNLWESVFAVAAADRARHNFGWNIVEGTHCFDADTGGNKKSCDRSGLTPPLVEYPHVQGCSITGGFVYRGKALPALDGRYFYADYCTGLLRSLVWQDGAVREHWDWKRAIDKRGVLTQISSFGVDHDGELYIVELTGSIYKLVPAR